MSDEEKSSKDTQSTSDAESNAKKIIAPPIDEAVNDIVRHESDEVLAAEDGQEKTVVRDVLPWYKRRKVYIPAIIVIILVALFSVPATRYPILGVLWKQNYNLSIVDSQTNQPVTAATISLDGKTTQSNNLGQATLRVKVGKARLVISKKYYASDSQTVLVPIRLHGRQVFQLQATGRQVPISLTNTIGGSPINDATISSDGTETTTNANGQASIVLPADKTTESATLTANGYNNLSVSIQVTAAVVATNHFQLVPSGQVYFLSNASGTVDVIKTNLDGSDPQTVLKGTGNEDPNNTQLLASRDWKYIALIARRNGTYANLYVINTSNDQLTDIDSSNANFNFDGWTTDDDLIYTANVNNVPPGQPGTALLKSYNSSDEKNVQLDETSAQTDSTTNDSVDEIYDSVNILNGNTILYLKSWQGNVSLFSNLNISLNTVLPNGNSKAVVQTFPQNQYSSYPSSAPGGPSSIYYYLYPNGSGSTVYYEYTNESLDQLTTDTAPAVAAQSSFTNYLLSPSSQATLWSSIVNGHTAINVGNAEANNQKQVALLDSDYSTIGWYTDNYILLSKNGNELYIMPSGGVNNTAQLVKISNYL